MPIRATETVMPAAGVLREFSLPRNAEGSPFEARPRNIRPV
jgi:hypothetical protein